jgi:argininosuccinate lyase
MLHRQRILATDVASALAFAILQLEQQDLSAFTLDPAREDPYFNYEATLIAHCGPNVGGRLHTARSRNDLYATIDRLRARAGALATMASLTKLRETLLERANTLRTVVMPGYTHLQPAQPITFGFYLCGFAKALERDAQRIVDCYGRINVSPLGAGAIAGTSFPIDREITAGHLAFDTTGDHAQDDITARDYLVELLSHLSQVATTLGRLAHDLFVMTTYEFRTVELPDSVAQTSSMMPQKKNMSVLENLRAEAAVALGAYVSAASGLRATHYSFGFDSCCTPFRWAWDSIVSTRRALDIAEVVVHAVEPRAERMMELCQDNFSTVTDLADLLVREAAIPFRDAHHVVGGVVRACIDSGLSAKQINADLVAEVSGRVLGRRIELQATQVQSALDPNASVEARRNCGGPSNVDFERLFDRLCKRLNADKTWLEAASSRVTDARKRLESEFADLAANKGPV